MFKQTPIARACAIACLACGPVAHAADAGSIMADVDKLAPLSLLELINTPVVTASRQSETRDQTPAHIVVVTRQQIRERRYKNLADLLEDMPGVDFQRGTKTSQYNQFSVQGYTGPNKLLVMLDGVRIGHPAGGNFPPAATSRWPRTLRCSMRSRSNSSMALPPRCTVPMLSLAW